MIEPKFEFCWSCDLNSHVIDATAVFLLIVFIMPFLGPIRKLPSVPQTLIFSHLSQLPKPLQIKQIGAL